jgi:imidazolonepropionase-like amidohydrolase
MPVIGSSGMHCAIRRQFGDGTPFEVENAVDPDLALTAYTANPAIAIGQGDRLGRIAPGYLADLTVLASDPRAATAWTLAQNPVQHVFVSGVEIAR